MRAVFSLDALDYRLTANTALSTAPAKLRSANLPSSSSSSHASAPSAENAESRKTRKDAPPSNWRKPEFLFYYFAFAVLVPMMFKVAFDVSKGLCRRDDPRTQ